MGAQNKDFGAGLQTDFKDLFSSDPCEVYVKLCHMFSVMKILLKQNIEAKGSAKETNFQIFWT